MTTHYRMQYRLVGPGSPNREEVTTRDVTVGYDKYTLASTDEEALENVQHFIDRPWLDVHVEVTRLTKVITTIEHEDVTSLLSSG